MTVTPLASFAPPAWLVNAHLQSIVPSLRLRRPLLHDGSAATPADAIRRHAGEAELARRGFDRLSDADRGALLAFLRSL